MADEESVFRAPWGKSVKALSLFSTVFLIAITGLEAVVIPRDLLGGWPWLAATALPLLTLALSSLFVVRRYSLEGSVLSIDRLLWQTSVRLDSLERAWSSPDAMSGSLRLFGNGGLFSITGIFRNRRLGTYRAFAMDSKKAVVLVFAHRTVVVTPDPPDAFLARLQTAAPWVELGERAR